MARRRSSDLRDPFQWGPLVRPGFDTLTPAELPFGVLSKLELPPAEALLTLVRVPLAGAAGFAAAAPVTPPLFFWTATCLAFFSRSSLGSSSETTSPALSPSWISAQAKSETPTLTLRFS